MNGQNVPYQLRTNKFVERQVFLDALEFVRVWNGSTDYVYASMGGRFLEDFRQINDRFAIEHLVSIEGDETTCKRQRFNLPIGFVDCRHQMSGDFITDFDSFVNEYDDSKFIVWLDYAAANDRQSQLQEFEELSAKVASGDVLKVTLNANHQSTKKRSEYKISNDEYDALVLIDFRQQLEGYLPEGGITSGHLKADSFAELLADCARIAALRQTEGTGLQPVPLLSCRYSDGAHQMLTVTMIVADSKLRNVISADARFQAWPFRSTKWSHVHDIRVPDLSYKERLWINAQLTTDAKLNEIHESLGFMLADRKSKSIELLKLYIAHYRRYPSFGRIYT